VNPEAVASAIRGAIDGDSDTTWSSTNDDEDDLTLGLADGLRRMELGAPNSPQFVGKSSAGMLVRTAIELKKEYAGDDDMFGNPQMLRPKNQRADFWGAKSVCYTLRISFSLLTSILVGTEVRCNRIV